MLREAKAADPAVVEAEFAQARYGEFKTAVAEGVVEYLAPVRERYEQLRSDEGALESVLREGARQAHAIASETLADVREHMGVGPPDANRAAPAASPSGTVDTLRG